MFDSLIYINGFNWVDLSNVTALSEGDRCNLSPWSVSKVPRFTEVKFSMIMFISEQQVQVWNMGSLSVVPNLNHYTVSKQFPLFSSQKSKLLLDRT